VLLKVIRYSLFRQKYFHNSNITKNKSNIFIDIFCVSDILKKVAIIKVMNRRSEKHEKEENENRTL